MTEKLREKDYEEFVKFGENCITWWNWLLSFSLNYVCRECFSFGVLYSKKSTLYVIKNYQKEQKEVQNKSYTNH